MFTLPSSPRTLSLSTLKCVRIPVFYDRVSCFILKLHPRVSCLALHFLLCVSLLVFFSSLTHFTRFLIPSVYHCVCVQLLLSPLSSSVSSMLFRCGLSSAVWFCACPRSSALLCVSTWCHPAFLTSIFCSVSLHLLLSPIGVFFLFLFLVFSLMCTFVATLFWVLVTHFFDFSSSIGFVFQRCFFKVRLLFPISLLPYVCVTICRHLEHFVGCFKC